VRVTHRIVVHRAVFNFSTAVLAAAAGGTVLFAVAPGGYPGMPPGWAGLGAVALAAGARFLVNSMLVVGAIKLSSPDASLTKVLGNANDYVSEAAALSLGAAVAGLLAVDAPFMLFLAVPVLMVHRALLVNQLQEVARKDGKTGLLNATFWHELAGKEVERARRLGSTVGVLMVDIDHFKAVNDRYGHLAGDQVLRQLAAVLKAEVREYDLVGRFGGEEFVLLLPAISDEELGRAAERVRLAVHQIRVLVPGSARVVRNLSVSVGGAMYPTMASSLDELLQLADKGLFAAKDAGRDRVIIIGHFPSDAPQPDADRVGVDGPFAK
jgi:diguanylate cyclase (GGDEF)-like protein